MATVILRDKKHCKDCHYSFFSNLSVSLSLSPSLTFSLYNNVKQNRIFTWNIQENAMKSNKQFRPHMKYFKIELILYLIPPSMHSYYHRNITEYIYIIAVAAFSLNWLSSKSHHRLPAAFYTRFSLHSSFSSQTFWNAKHCTRHWLHSHIPLYSLLTPEK